ncbi:carbamoyltransferase N-terminal domain-containing protein [Desulfobacter curvatus]|uniref:carbamoyltransferase N-terminal domain-containing protein n=1 Tax=Desulfobacter curvatus TaxID=2290 RepID=UPI00037BEA2F|nr:carbamoyltransferase N-terminal domain-containing protein [Desulfobacter curvatus]
MILGISANLHESAAALTHNGQLLAAAQEERFTRCKNDGSFPLNAITFCLHQAGISIQEIDKIGFYWNPTKGLSKRVLTAASSLPKSANLLFGNSTERGNLKNLARHILTPLTCRNKLGFTGKFNFHDHHLCHIAYAHHYALSDNAGALSIDLSGELHSTYLSHIKTGEFRTLSTVEYPHSLGSFYGTITQFLGYRPNYDEFKVMGLAQR